MVVLGQQIPIDSISDVVNTADVTTWDFVWAGVTVIVGVVLAGIGRGVVRRYSVRANLPLNMTDLLGTIALWTIVSISVVLALTFVGLDVAPLWILIILVIIVFAIGGRSLLESFGAGVLLQARAPFEPGDFVTLGSDSGVVHEVNSRVVVLDTVDGRRVFVPNSKVIAEPIVNLTHRPIRMTELALDVAYSTDLEAAADIACESLTGIDVIESEPGPTALVTSFEESAIRITLRFWHASRMVDEWVATDAAARAVHAAYQHHDIEFAFPQRTLWWGEEPPSTDD